MFIKFLRFILKVFLTVFIRVKFINSGAMPDTGGVILCCNHLSAYDPVILGSAVNNRLLRYMAKKEVFKNFFLRILIKALGAYPVDRNSAKSAITSSIDMIKKGEVICIFPEGTRSKDLKPHEPKAGVALIAKNAKCGVVTSCIYTTGKIKFFSKVIVKIGDYISYEELGIGEGTSTQMKAASELIMNNIKSMWSELDEKYKTS